MKKILAGLLIAILFGSAAEARSLVDIGDPQSNRKGTHIAWVDIDLDGKPEDIRIWWKNEKIKIYWGNGNRSSQPLPIQYRNETPVGVVGDGNAWWVIYSVRWDYESHYIYVADQVVIDFQDDLPTDGTCPTFSDGVQPVWSMLTTQPATSRLRIEGLTPEGDRYTAQYYADEWLSTGVATIMRAYFNPTAILPSGAFHWEMLANDHYESGCIIVTNSPLDMPVE